MYKRISIVLTALLALGGGIFVFPSAFGQVVNEQEVISAEKPPWLTSAEWSFLRNHPVIRIAPDPNFSPIESIDNDGNYIGLSADYTQVVEALLGVTFTVFSARNWDEVLERAEAKDVDVLPAAANTPQRQEYLNFASAHLILPGVIIVREQAADALTLSDLTGKSVAIVSGYVWQELVEAEHPEIDVVPVPNLETALGKVAFGSVDAAIATLPVAIETIGQAGIPGLQVAGETGYATHLSFAVRKDWPLLASAIEKALAQIPASESQAIYNKWINLGVLDEPIIKSRAFRVSASLGLSIIALIFVAASIWTKSLSIKVKRRTRELQVSEERFKGFFENSEISIWHEDYSAVYTTLQNIRREGVRDLRQYLESNAGKAGEIASKVKVVQVNKATLKLFGAQSETDFIYRIDETFGEGAINVFIDQLCAIWNREKSFRSESNYRSLDGKYIRAIISVPIPDAEIGFRNVPVTIADITEQKNAEAALARSEQLLSAILDNAPVSISVKDRDGMLLSANPVTRRRLGIPLPDDLWEKPYKVLENPQTTEAIKVFDRDVFKTGRHETRVIHRHLEGGDTVTLATKFPIFDADGKIPYIGSIGIDITKQRKIEDALRQSEARFALALKCMVVGSIVIDEYGTVEIFNAAAEEIFGHDSDEVIGQNVSMLMPETYASGHDGYLQNNIATGEETFIGLGREVTGRRKNGDEFPMHIGVGEMILDKGSTFICSVSDLTRVKELEAQLRQSQRLEAVGQLTSGIAHDFNNLLGVMIGNAEILGDKIGGDKTAMHNIAGIIGAVERGATLTERLLAFGRKQTLAPRVTDIGELTRGIDDMLRRSLGEETELLVNTAKGLWPALIDSAQLEHALVNMAVNARYAMSTGGVLQVSATNAVLDARQIGTENDVVPGEYVEIEVRDTGTGMPPEILARVFEPFFTTKEVGEGSGLGLSMVFGFVKQSGGHIVAESEVGIGTTFRLYLPRSYGDVSTDVKDPTIRGNERGTERILVVEDDRDLREIPVSALRDHGYDVEGVADGKEAIIHLENDEPFDLLFTDMVLPGGISGADIAEQARELQPGIKVIYTTGYTDGEFGGDQNMASVPSLIKKPFRISELLAAVRNELDNRVK